MTTAAFAYAYWIGGIATALVVINQRGLILETTKETQIACRAKGKEMGWWVPYLGITVIIIFWPVFWAFVFWPRK